MKTLTVIKLAFTLVGTVLLAVAIALGWHTRQFLASSQRAVGTVVDLLPSRSSSGGSVMYSPVFEFRAADGRMHEVRSSVASSPPGYEEGEEVTVWYPAGAPGQARLDSFFELWGGATIVGGIGAVFFAIGAGLWVGGLRSARTVRDLLARGTPVQAKVHEVERNTSMSVDGEHPWRIVARAKHPATAKVQSFRSGNLWTDPTDRLGERLVTVYVDPNRPTRYHMDTAFLD